MQVTANLDLTKIMLIVLLKILFIFDFSIQQNYERD
jgi:hypothetical protein